MIHPEVSVDLGDSSGGLGAGGTAEKAVRGPEGLGCSGGPQTCSAPLLSTPCIAFSSLSSLWTIKESSSGVPLFRIIMPKWLQRNKKKSKPTKQVPVFPEIFPQAYEMTEMWEKKNLFDLKIRNVSVILYFNIEIAWYALHTFLCCLLFVLFP